MSDVRTAGPPDQQMKKQLTWRDGFSFALIIPIGIFLTLGYTIGAIGAWWAIGLWTLAAVVAYLQNHLFAEMAAMFPTKSGGISVYAYEGWKRYFAPLGAVAAFGYWMGWSLTLSVVGVAFGSLMKSQFLPDMTWSVRVFGNTLGVEHVLAVVAMAAAWGLNYFGVKIAAGVARLVGLLLLAGVVVLAVGPFLSPGVQFDVHRLTASSAVDWKILVVWYYVTCWTVYGTEVCASYAPEYRDTTRDTLKALRAAALFILVLYVVVPTTVTGTVGEDVIRDNPVSYVKPAFDAILGRFSWLGMVPIMAAFVIAMMTATGDGGRSLFGIASSGGTLRQFAKLNRWGVPGRALTFDVVINTTILVVLGNPLAILLASNLGYLSAVTLAVGAFVLLRKDLPRLDRPFRLGRAWIAVAIVIFVFNVFVLTIGVSFPGLAGYGGLSQTMSGIAILCIAVVLFIYRTAVQDRRSIEWRIRDPEPVPAAPAQCVIA